MPSIQVPSVMPSRVRDTTQGIGIGIEIERRSRNTGLLLETLLLDPPSAYSCFPAASAFAGPSFPDYHRDETLPGILIIHSQDSSQSCCSLQRQLHSTPDRCLHRSFDRLHSNPSPRLLCSTAQASYTLFPRPDLSQATSSFRRTGVAPPIDPYRVVAPKKVTGFC